MLSVPLNYLISILSCRAASYNATHKKNNTNVLIITFSQISMVNGTLPKVSEISAYLMGIIERTEKMLDSMKTNPGNVSSVA